MLDNFDYPPSEKFAVSSSRTKYVPIRVRIGGIEGGVNNGPRAGRRIEDFCHDMSITGFFTKDVGLAAKLDCPRYLAEFAHDQHKGCSEVPATSVDCL